LQLNFLQSDVNSWRCLFVSSFFDMLHYLKLSIAPHCEALILKVWHFVYC